MIGRFIMLVFTFAWASIMVVPCGLVALAVWVITGDDQKAWRVIEFWAAPMEGRWPS